MSESERSRPCPFCRSIAPPRVVALPGGFVARCGDADCLARGPVRANREDAAAAWDGRGGGGEGGVVVIEDDGQPE